MRAIIQRVSSASVTVDGEVISQISKGLMVLVGIGSDDTTKDVEYIAKKILTLRVFDDSDGTMWKAGVKDIGGEVLSVSQFTLMANTTKGNKPDFHGAMSSASSREVYSTFLKRLGELYEPAKIKDGQFGAMMSVSLANEGPVTLQIDSRKFEYVPIDDSKPSKKARSGTTTPATPAENAQSTTLN